MSAKTNEEQLQKVRNDYEAAFSSPQGERVLSDLRIFCGATHDSFAAGDPYQTSYNEGKRRVWLRIESSHTTKLQTGGHESVTTY